MLFATFSRDGRELAGVVSDAGLHPLADGISVLQLVRAGLPDALEAGRAVLDGPALPLAEVRLLPPLDPHGNTVEYTTELEQVDEDTWHPHLYDFTQPEVADQWGTANQMNEVVARKSFNDPDRGMFVAPPV